MFLSTVIVLTSSLPLAASDAKPPAPFGPLPTARHLRWHKLEYYGFLHFGINTFTDKEWGYGDEDPKLFAPTRLDARQWARVARDAGMKGLILTAKHHDGFCLWPSAYTEHSVKNSLWRNGKGDVVKELAEACRSYGLLFGVYLSPWDRNHPDYGKPAYITYYRNQLRELLTRYGPVFEVWFDGANGGTGYYGGARERRLIDRRTYYRWQETWAIVRKFQPQAVIFSDAGPDVRWVGNERGKGAETNWATLRRKEFYPGCGRARELPSGHRDGTHWVPAEADVSIRPGWFYHPSQDKKIKSLSQLLRIYFWSVGRGCNLLLNVPPDRRGLIAEPDVQRLLELKRALDATFKKDLARGKPVRASNVRCNSKKFLPSNLTDGDRDTYWATDDSVRAASVVIDFGRPIRFNCVRLQEYIQLGQRIEGFKISGRIRGKWKQVAEGTTIGPRRILIFDTIEADQLEVSITSSPVCVTLSTVEVYLAPPECVSALGK